MMQELATPGSILVGIDGSKTAIGAALWAADEAVSRDVPLRLLCAMERGNTRDADRMADRHIAAENAVRQAATAVEATGQPVKIETKIVVGPPVSSLIRASASPAMLCLGAVGLRHFQPGRVGSTAAALALWGRCPVAIVRGRDRYRRHPDEIVVDVEGLLKNGVLLGTAIGEALLRNAPIRAVICRQAVSGDDGAERDRDRRARADLDRRLAPWRQRYPNIEVESVVVHGSLLDYLARNHRSMRLVIVGASNRQHVRELLGPIGAAMLQDSDSSLLIVNRRNL